MIWLRFHVVYGRPAAWIARAASITLELSRAWKLRNLYIFHQNGRLRHNSIKVSHDQLAKEALFENSVLFN